MKNLLTFLASCIFLFSCSTDDTIDVINSQNIIESNINEDTVLEDIISDPNVADYIVRGYLDVNALLTINPGVVIAFDANAGFFIKGVTSTGVIKALGTSTNPIIFTGVGKTPGFWRGISIQSKDVRNELSYCVLEYAGSDFLVEYSSVRIKGGLALNSISGGFDGGVKLKNTIIRNCSGYGFIAEQGTVIREFSANNFSDNEKAAVRIDADNVGMLDSESNYAGKNGMDGVEVNASGSPTHKLTLDATWPALKSTATYFIAQSFQAEAKLTISAGVRLAFEANQTITFREDFSGNNDGILIANGTADKQIIFTAMAASPGYWPGLIIRSSSILNKMDYCIVEYGGSDPIVGNKKGNIGLDKDGAFDAPKLIITNSILRNSTGCGIVVDTFGGTLTESGNTFESNSEGSICM
jgi:hypothetical protein